MEWLVGIVCGSVLSVAVRLLSDVRLLIIAVLAQTAVIAYRASGPQGLVDEALVDFVALQRDVMIHPRFWIGVTLGFVVAVAGMYRLRRNRK